MKELGADAYIKKPFDINNMLLNVRNFIQLVDKNTKPENLLSA